MNESELLERFAEVESEIKKLLIKAYESTKPAGAVRKIVYEDIEKLLAYLEQGSDSFVDFAVPEEYKRGLQSAADQLLSQKFIQNSAIQFAYITNFTIAPPIMQEKVVSLIEGYKNAFGDTYKAASSTAKKSLSKVLALKGTVNEAKGLDASIRKQAIEITQKQAMKDLFTGKSFDQITRDVANQMKKMVGTESAVMFRDKAGRKWTFTRYANLMTRDIINQSYREGQRGNFIDVGLDVVKTNDTGTTDSCIVWQGKIFSLTGRTPGIPTYAQIQMDHTHMFSYGCLHEIIYVSPEEATKLIEQQK